MPIYEYRCENERCPAKEEIVEIEVKLADLYNTLTKCEKCGEKLVRLISSMKMKHGSWSRWAV